MTADKPVEPQFGPNGAVMNAPGMSDEMRRKINGAGSDEQTLTPADRWVSLAMVLLLAFSLLSFIVGRHWLAQHPEQAPVVAATIRFAPVAFLIGYGMLNVRNLLKRWEIGRRRAGRRLVMPDSARRFFAGCDCLSLIAIWTFFPVGTLNWLGLGEGARFWGGLAALAVLLLAQLARAMLGAVARECGWRLRASQTAV